MWDAVRTHKYIWDGWNIAAEIVIDHVNPATNINYYAWGLDLSGTLQGAGGVGGLLCEITTGASATNTYYAFTDANGNITEYVDDTGAVKAHYEYNACGEITAQSGTLADDFTHRFSTKPYDQMTRLVQYQERPYDPVLSRWLSRDLIGIKGGLNEVGFVGNDAVNQWDFLGALPFKQEARQAWRDIIRLVLIPRGWNVAAFFLNHSLQDNPSDLYLKNTHFVSSKIQNSKEYNEKLDLLVQRQPVGYKGYVAQDTIEFGSGDLFAGIHYAFFDYNGYVCKRNDYSYDMDLDIKIHDKYDFRFQSNAYYFFDLDHILGTTANNLAWLDQLTGAIENYNWDVTLYEKRSR